MVTTVDAVYESGLFKPQKNVALRDGQRVKLTITTRPDDQMADADFTLLASQEALGHIWNDQIEDEAWAHL